jgi:hypothetical protein
MEKAVRWALASAAEAGHRPTLAIMLLPRWPAAAHAR